MKKGILFSLIITITLLLSGCLSKRITLEYTVIDTTINDYEVVQITVKNSSAGYCEAFSTTSIPLDDTTNIQLTYGCMGEGYFISINDDYMRFDRAVLEGYITASDILDSGLGYIQYSESILNHLDIIIDHLLISEISIHEMNGALALDGSGAWDTNYTVSLDLNQLEQYLFPLLGKHISDINYCDSDVCAILLKGQAPIELTLQSTDYIINIQVYEDYLDIHVEGDNYDGYAYGVKDELGNAESLFQLISDIHESTNK